MSYLKLSLVAAVAALVGLFFAFDAQHCLALDYL